MNFLRQGFRKLSYYSMRMHDMHVVTCVHFRQSRDKDGGRTIGSDIPENPILRAHLIALSVIEAESWAVEVYIGIFNPFAPVTFTR